MRYMHVWQEQGVTFVCVDGLQVHDVPNDMVLISDAVSAQHVAGLAGDVQSFATGVPLQHGDHLRRGPAGQQQPSETEMGTAAKGARGAAHTLLAVAETQYRIQPLGHSMTFVLDPTVIDASGP